jgi:hypothetical protein
MSDATHALSVVPQDETLVFDELVRLLSGRVVPAAIVARVQFYGVFPDVHVEHVQALGSVCFGRHEIVADGEDLMNKLGSDEMSRLNRLAERRSRTETD